MIKAENAVLRVKHITGRNGLFSVADLDTSFGKFKVKEALLDQFDEGEYQVHAWITDIYMGQYVAWGKAITEIRAVVHDLQVISEDQDRRPVEQQIEVDPLEETSAQVAPAPEPVPLPAPAPAGDSRWDKFKKKISPTKGTDSQHHPEPDAKAQVPDSADADLYDEQTWTAIQNGESVKLDPAVDRTLLRKQTACLKELGYRFDSTQQTWHPFGVEPMTV